MLEGNSLLKNLYDFLGTYMHDEKLRNCTDKKIVHYTYTLFFDSTSFHFLQFLSTVEYTLTNPYGD